MTLTQIRKLRDEFMVGDAETQESLRNKLITTEVAFRCRGHLGYWSPHVLDQIDKCFLQIYKPDGKVLSPYLFFPVVGRDHEGVNVYLRYCAEVDKVLAANPDHAPPYAREYFAYFSINKLHGFNVPMPLGTKSVVSALEELLKGVHLGFVEVSHPSSTFSTLAMLPVGRDPSPSLRFGCHALRQRRHCVSSIPHAAGLSFFRRSQRRRTDMDINRPFPGWPLSCPGVP